MPIAAPPRVLAAGAKTVTRACSSGKVSAPKPSSLVFRIASCTAARLAGFSPVRPRAWSCARLGDGLAATTPASVAATASASTCNSAAVSAWVLGVMSITSPSKLTLSALSTPVMPSAA